jgi:hypothetical protein
MLFLARWARRFPRNRRWGHFALPGRRWLMPLSMSSPRDRPRTDTAGFCPFLGVDNRRIAASAAEPLGHNQRDLQVPPGLSLWHGTGRPAGRDAGYGVRLDADWVNSGGLSFTSLETTAARTKYRPPAPDNCRVATANNRPLPAKRTRKMPPRSSQFRTALNLSRAKAETKCSRTKGDHRGHDAPLGGIPKSASTVTRHLSFDASVVSNK